MGFTRVPCGSVFVLGGGVMKKKYGIIAGILVCLAIWILYRIQAPVLRGTEYSRVVFTVVNADGSGRAETYSVTDEDRMKEICDLLNDRKKTPAFHSFTGSGGWSVHLTFYAGTLERYQITVCGNKIEYKGTVLRKTFRIEETENLKEELGKIGKK